jgi:NAD(P)-dependent dehydrogenase (short-subunit alcohol dehydrogenase family)
MDTWHDGAHAYKGTTVPGYPNLFLIIGPNTGLGHNSMILMIEAQVAYILDALKLMQRHRIASVDVKPAVESLYNQQLQDKLKRTIWNTGGCQSWYLDPRTGKNTTLWPGSTWRFKQVTRQFALKDYLVKLVPINAPARPAATPPPPQKAACHENIQRPRGGDHRRGVRHGTRPGPGPGAGRLPPGTVRQEQPGARTDPRVDQGRDPVAGAGHHPRGGCADRPAMENWAARCMAEHGQVNLVFNNAGVALSSTVEGVDYADLEWIVGINFWGVVHGTKAFLPYLKASGEGHVINTSSVFGLFAQPGMSGYNATKFAVRGFTEALRQELDLQRCGVSATCVHPGIRTDICRSSHRREHDRLSDPQRTTGPGRLRKTLHHRRRPGRQSDPAGRAQKQAPRADRPRRVCPRPARPLPAGGLPGPGGVRQPAAGAQTPRANAGNQRRASTLNRSAYHAADPP